MSSLHSTCDSLVILLYIRPYREHLLSLLHSLRSGLGRKPSTMTNSLPLAETPATSLEQLANDCGSNEVIRISVINIPTPAKNSPR